MTNPTLSVITVVKNNKKFFEQTIDNLVSQTFKDYEIIIIDGGSTDNTLENITKYKDHIGYCVSEPDDGIYDAMNKGLAHAKGKWITFLNAGDWYVSSTILDTVFSKINTETHLCYGDMFMVTEDGEPVRSLKAEKLTKNSITKGMIACQQSMFIRRQYCPNYKTQYPNFACLEWLMNLLHRTSSKHILYIPADIVYYRQGGFSSFIVWKQLYEHLQFINQYYHWYTIIYRLPQLCRRYIGKYARNKLGISTFRFWATKKT